MWRSALAVLVACCSLTSLHAKGVGTSGLQFLSLRAASKAESLAGAMTAIGEDLSSLQINPATVSRIRYKEALLSQALLFEDIKFSYFAYAHPTRKWGVPTIEYMNISFGDFDDIDRDGNRVGTQSPGDSFIGFGWSTQQSRRSGDGGGGAASPSNWWGRYFNNLDVGAVVRYFRSDLGAASASGMSLNFGGLYRTPLEGLSAGLSINNMGSSVKFANESFSQPRTIRAGLGYATNEFLALSSKAKFSFDLVLPNDGSFYPALGIELSMMKFLSIQAGYAGEENLENRIRFGFGIGIDAVNMNYSAAPSPDLGTTHRISMRFRFGGGVWNLMNVFSGEYGIRQDIEMARTYRDQGQFKRAAFYANKVMKKKPEHAEALGIIKAIVKRERAKMASEVYGEVVALVRLGLFEEAEEKIRICLELDPENQTYQSILEKITAELKKPKPAVEIVQATVIPVVEQKADAPEPEKVKEAPKESATAPAKTEEEVVPPQKVASTKVKPPSQGKTEVIATKPEVTVVKDQPSSDPALRAEYGKALEFMRKRNLDEAIRIFRAFIEKNKKHREAPIKIAECLKGRGVKHFAKGRYEESHRDFQEALNYNPKDSVLKKFLNNVEQMLESLNLSR